MGKEKGYLRLAAPVIFLITVFQFSSCHSSSHQPNLKDLAFANKSTNKPANKLVSIAEENFAKEWKSKFDKTIAELERNRNLWKQNRIADYDFVVAKSAPGHINEWNRLPVLIKIRGGEKISIEMIEKDKDYVIYSRTDGFENFDVIDKLFNYLQQELEKGSMLEVKYHKDLGYPKTATIIDSYGLHSYRGIIVDKIEIIKNI